MEIRAYIEGILRGWWLIGLLLILSFVVGTNYGQSQQAQYTAFTSVQLNGPLLTKYADPTNVLQLSLPQSYTSLVATPAQLNIIQQHYPQFTTAVLQKEIVVTEDTDKQTLVIRVTDSSPQFATDIANYLMQQFVHAQMANLQRQIDYYTTWLPQQISTLQQAVGTLSLQIQQLTPVPQRHNAPVTPISPADQRTIASDQYQLDVDQRQLYSFQNAYADLQNSRPQFAKAFTVLQTANLADVTVIPPTLTLTTVRLIALGIGLLVAIILLILSDYLIQVVRHEGEIRRIANLPVLAKCPSLFRFELKRLMRRDVSAVRRRVQKVRAVCAQVGSHAMNAQGHTILLTSPKKKRHFAPLLASNLASAGYSTLLIDLDFTHPTLEDQVQLARPCDLYTGQGQRLSFIRMTSIPQLFAFTAKGTLDQNRPMNSQMLMELLPELQKLFNVIIIDAPPLDCADTHLFARSARQVLLQVKKRRDSLTRLKMAQALDQELRLHMNCLLLT